MTNHISLATNHFSSWTFIEIIGIEAIRALRKICWFNSKKGIEGIGLVLNIVLGL